MFKAITRLVFAFAAVFCLGAAVFFVWFGWQHGTPASAPQGWMMREAGGIFVLAGLWALLAVAFGVIYRRARRWE